jgi:hypothetical protein
MMLTADDGDGAVKAVGCDGNGVINTVGCGR